MKVGWDENDGSSAAYDSAEGAISSESFDIQGDATSPEPGSLMLLGSGLLVLAGAWRRKASR